MRNEDLMGLDGDLNGIYIMGFKGIHWDLMVIEWDLVNTYGGRMGIEWETNL